MMTANSRATLMEVRSAGLSDVGRLRSDNEDDFLIDEKIGLFALADGVGGAAAGEVASHIFIKTCHRSFTSNNKNSIELPALLQNCFRLANDHIAQFAFQSPDSSGMGCTGDILGFDKQQYFVGHVGDSRCYLVRNHEITQITKDHTVQQEQFDQGLINESALAVKNSAIYLAVGHMKNEHADIYKGEYQSGDVFLLCSDGLSDLLPSSTIQNIINEEKENLEQAAQRLVDAANIEGGKDNITVVLVKVV